jgi:trehalose 2-sulfotransferase
MPVTISSYFITTMPRSGGHLLCEALESAKIAGMPNEYFEPDFEHNWRDRLRSSAEDVDYFEKVVILRSTPNGVFGAKVIWPQYELLKRRLRPIYGRDLGDLELLERRFPHLRFVWLRRRDKVRQAISYYKAIWTDVWHSAEVLTRLGQQSPSRPPTRETPFDFREIDKYVRYFNEAEEKWARYFEEVGVVPIEVVYEDFAQAYEPTVVDILCSLEIPIPAGFRVAPPRLQKLADKTSDDWVERYEEMKRSPRSFRLPVKISYLIDSTPRTGSHLLCQALESSRVAGEPKEYFDPSHESFWLKELDISTEAEYFEKILGAGTTWNGVFGAKVHWHQFEHLGRKLRQIGGDGAADLELLHRRFPGLRHVFLTRRDKVRQAISYYRAIKTGVWWSTAARPHGTRETAPPVPPFNFEEIDHWVTRLEQFDAEWRGFFKASGIEPLEVVYEDFAQSYEATVQAILRYLEIPEGEDARVAPPQLRRQSDDLTEEWVRRYHEIRRSRAALGRLNRSYFIASSPRTGSTLLADALESTRIAGKPQEYFEPARQEQYAEMLKASADGDFLEKVRSAGMTPNGVFGAKVHWHQFTHLTAKIRDIRGVVSNDSENLQATFPGLRYVFLTRRDKVRQAVSYYRAIKTGIWWAFRPDATGVRRPPEQRDVVVPLFDFEQIDQWVLRLTAFETNWRRYFTNLGIKPIEVVYEDFVESYESTVLAILNSLEIPVPEGLVLPPPRLQKLADEVSEDWVARYRRLKKA